MLRRLLRVLGASPFLMSAAAAQAQTTKGEISFTGTAPGQGTFGSANLTFKLYDAAAEGNFLNYSDAQLSVPVASDDSFSARLGAGAGGDVPPDHHNTATGVGALILNTTGIANTAIGVSANVAVGDLVNATAIGAFAVVDASNKIRLGDSQVTVIEGQVGFTASSDVHQKENLEPVDGEDVLGKIRSLSLTSWNFIGHDPSNFATTVRWLRISSPPLDMMASGRLAPRQPSPRPISIES